VRKTAMAYSDRLLERVRPIRERIVSHPFVRGIGDGTLPAEKFGYYMRQDYVYLIEYCRVFALASAKATDLETMGRLAELLHSTLNVEMELHRRYANEFGVSREELERTDPSATTHAYTRHLLTVAWGGSLGEVVASIFPCQWDYWELARALADKGAVNDGNRYRSWIETYIASDYEELTRWVRGLLDRLAEGAGEDQLARMEQQFMASARYELMFWDMAWEGQGWPV
jgi:thiaminase (transcriptional activator TenA)